MQDRGQTTIQIGSAGGDPICADAGAVAPPAAPAPIRLVVDDGVVLSRDARGKVSSQAYSPWTVRHGAGR